MDEKNPLVVGRINFGDNSGNRSPRFTVKELRPITSAVDGNLDTIEAECSTHSLATKSEKEIREALARVETFLEQFKGQSLDDEMVRLLDVQVGKAYALKWVVGDIEKI